MTGRTPPSAVQRFLDRTQRVLDCVTDAVVDARGGYHVADTPHTLTVASGAPVRMSGAARLSLTVMISYRIVTLPDDDGLYRVVTTGYLYAVDDEDGAEMLAFHWHTGGRSPVTYPHLHLGAGARVGRPEVAGAHIPTGQIGLSQVVRLAIEELGVEPRRPDWREVLDDAGRSFDDR